MTYPLFKELPVSIKLKQPKIQTMKNLPKIYTDYQRIPESNIQNDELLNHAVTIDKIMKMTQ